MKKFVALASVATFLTCTFFLLAGKEPGTSFKETARQEETLPVAKQVDTPAIPLPVTNIGLNDDQVVQILEPIQEALAARVVRQIQALAKNQKPVYVLLDSPGGSVLDGGKIIAAMQASKVPVYTVCIGTCASMAAIIHQYGTERYMEDRSILMFHSASGGVQGTLEHMNSLLSTITRYVYKMDSFVAKRANLTLEQFHDLTIRDLWIDSEDATARKFNDKIVSVDVDTFNVKEVVPSSSNIKQKFNLDWR